MKTFKYIVTGKVQGVWFRATTKKLAIELGITGYANNLAAGQVKVMASGTIKQHEELSRFLQIGSEDAQVISVDVEEMPQTQFDAFTTG